MNRNTKNSTVNLNENNNSNNKKLTKSKNDVKLQQESTKLKSKLRSLNEISMQKTEQEIMSVIRYNYTSPTTTAIASNFSKVKNKNNKGLVNNDYCSYCDEGGDLLNCDRCPASFHLLCSNPPLSFDQIPPGEFICNKCNTRAELTAKESNQETLNLNETPIINNTKTIKFEVEEKESSLETLIRIAKSLNPRQMQLSKDLNMQCAFDLPGLNKIKWWTKDGNKIVNTFPTNSNSESSSASNSNTNFLNNSSLNGNSTQPQSEVNSNQNENQSIYNKNEFCFTCSKNGKENQLVKCDFCPLRYHLNCLNPPLCSMPSRDRLWMCPNHMENFLENNILESDRLTKRINLWKKFSMSNINFNTVKIDFINKCSKQKENSIIGKDEGTNSELKYIKKLTHCKIPGAIKHIYSKMKDMSLDFNAEKVENDEICFDNANSATNNLNTRTFLNENEKESYIMAVQALQLLSNPSLPINNQMSEIQSEPLSNQNRSFSIQAPPLNRHCSEAVKPRALLQYIPHNTLLNSGTDDTVQITEMLSSNAASYESFKHKLPQANYIRYRSLNIGTSSDMDICLDNSFCQFVSDKHACIFYDEQTNHYELLNYSEYGTVVDNCLYGFNLDPLADFEEDYNSDNHSEETDIITKKSTSENSPSDKETGNRTNEPFRMFAKRRREFKETSCTCSHDRHINSNEECWEGSAVLNHGSRVRFGCLDFIFIIVDYDFVLSRNLNSQNNQASKFNYFYDIKNKKITKKFKNAFDKNELRSVQDYEYLMQSDFAQSSFMSKKKQANSSKISNKKLRKMNSGFVVKKKNISTSNGSFNGSSGNGCTQTAKRMVKKYKLEKVEAFLKLMNNTNKMNMLDSN